MKALKWHLCISAVAVLCLGLMSAPAQALIIITPIPDHPPNHHALRLAENNVRVEIIDRVAQVNAEFVYLNHSRRNLEGTFLFPLPAEAAVDNFSLFVNGEEIEAELLDRARARQIYEDIVRRQRDPALLEFADRQLLQARIFPITPQEGTRVRLYYTHPVPADFGTADFVYPLSVEKLEAASNCKITIDVELSSSDPLSDPLKTVYSPTHPIELDRPDEKSAKVACSPSTAGQRATDFHLLAMTAQDNVAANFLTCRDKDGVQYFMGMISPGLPDEDEVLPKDVVFCLDRSGSMAGEKINQAKAALRFCLEHLNEEDRFGLIIFNSDIDIFNPELSAATAENKAAAAVFFDRLEATGGTFIDRALGTSLEMFANSPRPKYLVFLTDGLPTVGTRNPNEILGNAEKKNLHGARVFAWGVGYDLNAGLINDLADQQHGIASYVEPGQDIEVELSHFFEKINRPVLADCRLDIDGVGITEMYPKELPDLFAGSEVVIVGRYDGGTPVTVTLTGRQGLVFKQFVFATDFEPHPDKYGFLPKLWAGRRIGYLLEDMRRHGENREVIDEIVALSKKYGIITPYTSFLVAPERPDLAWDQKYGERRGHDSFAPDVSNNIRAKAGRDIGAKKLMGVTTSDAGDLLYEHAKPGVAIPQVTPDGVSADELPLEKAQVRKTAGGKTFVRHDNIWTDSDLLTISAPADTIMIEKFSDAYFELIRAVPEFQAFLSVGDEVIILYHDVVIVIADTGEKTFRREWRQWFN
jgi:Ca-activated chloride channel family protein